MNSNVKDDLRMEFIVLENEMMQDGAFISWPIAYKHGPQTIIYVRN